MSFNDTIKALALCIQARIPALLEGPVGDGKTTIVTSLANKLCDGHFTSIVALHEPPEYGGYPVPQAERRDPEGKLIEPACVRQLPLQWAIKLAQVKKPLLHLDEFSNGAPAVRSATMRGVLEGMWGEQYIPNLSVVVSMNPPEIAESGYELSAPLSNRFCHLPWDMEVAYWREQHRLGFPEPEIGSLLPEGWEEAHKVWARTLVDLFAEKFPLSMKSTPDSAAQRSKPFPSLRSWTVAERALGACKALGYGIGGDGVSAHDVLVKLLSGCVGDGAAIEFITYASDLDLPDPEAVLAAPDKLVLPNRGDRAYAVLTAVMMAVLSKNTPDRYRAGWKVLDQAAKQGKVDVAAGAAKVLANNRPPDTDLPKEVNAFVPLLKHAGLI